MLSTRRARLRDYMRIARMYIKDFPRDERIFLPLLFSLSLKKGVTFTVFFDEKSFVGYTYTINVENMTHLLFLDINSQIRSKGYGSQVLNWIKAQAPSGNVALEIETLDEKAPNYEQRLRRKEFYLRNGFVESGFYEDDGKRHYEILSFGAPFEPQKMQDSYKKLLGSTFTPRFYRKS